MKNNIINNDNHNDYIKPESGYNAIIAIDVTQLKQDYASVCLTSRTLMTSVAADVINHNGRKNRSIQTFAILLCRDDVGSIVQPTPSLVWANVILADFERVISRYLQDISTYLSCPAQRVLRTIFMQKSKPKYACLPSKIVEVWIDRFCVRYDWWRLLQPTSSVSPVWCLWSGNMTVPTNTRKQLNMLQGHASEQNKSERVENTATTIKGAKTTRNMSCGLVYICISDFHFVYFHIIFLLHPRCSQWANGGGGLKSPTSQHGGHQKRDLQSLNFVTRTLCIFGGRWRTQRCEVEDSVMFGFRRWRTAISDARLDRFIKIYFVCGRVFDWS